MSSRSLANYPAKLQADIEALVAENNEAALKKMSQHNFRNAFWGIHFGLHDGSGIHGACIHAIHSFHTLNLTINFESAGIAVDFVPQLQEQSWLCLSEHGSRRYIES